jgi:hypothetical protein
MTGDEINRLGQLQVSHILSQELRPILAILLPRDPQH